MTRLTEETAPVKEVKPQEKAVPATPPMPSCWRVYNPKMRNLEFLCYACRNKLPLTPKTMYSIVNPITDDLTSVHWDEPEPMCKFCCDEHFGAGKCPQCSSDAMVDDGYPLHVYHPKNCVCPRAQK